jgi:hypothetical protein
VPWERLRDLAKHTDDAWDQGGDVWRYWCEG